MPSCTLIGFFVVAGVDFSPYETIITLNALWRFTLHGGPWYGRHVYLVRSLPPHCLFDTLALDDFCCFFDSCWRSLMLICYVHML